MTTTVTSNVNRRKKVSSLLDEEYSSSVSNLVANAAAVVVGTAVSRQIFRRRRARTNRGSVPGRPSFRARTRSSVQDVYKELGKVYFRRAYRMKYNTFKRLANILRPYIITAYPERKGPIDLSQMDKSRQTSGLPVQFDGLLVALRMTL